jgi:excisionase family DNA binding protein
MSRSKDMPSVLVVEEVSDLLRVSNSAVRTMALNGELQATKIGKRYLFPRYQFDALVDPEEQPINPDNMLYLKQTLTNLKVSIEHVLETI